MRVIRHSAVAIAIVAILSAGCDATPHGSAGPGPGDTADLGSASTIPIGSDQPGESGSPAAVQKIPACQLVFASEAATAIGVPISEAAEQTVQQDGDAWEVDCIYWGTSGYHQQAAMELTVATGSTAST